MHKCGASRMIFGTFGIVTLTIPKDLEISLRTPPNGQGYPSPKLGLTRTCCRLGDSVLLPVGESHVIRGLHTMSSGRCSPCGQSFVRLMIGGDLPDADAWTTSLLTNAEVIAVDQHSTDSRQILATE